MNRKLNFTKLQRDKWKIKDVPVNIFESPARNVDYCDTYMLKRDSVAEGSQNECIKIKQKFTLIIVSYHNNNVTCVTYLIKAIILSNDSYNKYRTYS